MEDEVDDPRRLVVRCPPSLEREHSRRMSTTEILDWLLATVELDTPTLLFGVVVVLTGAYLKGYAGFGAAMLWMAGLSLVLPPVQIVPMVLMFEVATSIALLPQIWKDVRWRSIGVLLIGTWVATPVGVYALASLPATPIRIALAIAVMIAAALLLRGFALKREPGRPATFGVGFAGGLLNGSMGIVGPPVILFYFSSPIGVIAGRASIITYFIGHTKSTMYLENRPARKLSPKLAVHHPFARALWAEFPLTSLVC